MFENFLLSYQKNGTYKEILVQYNFTKEEQDDYFKGVGVSLKNKVKYIYLEESDFSNQFLSRTSGSCYDEITTSGNTCIGRGEHTWQQILDGVVDGVYKGGCDYYGGIGMPTPPTTVIVDTCNGENTGGTTDTGGSLDPNDDVIIGSDNTNDGTGDTNIDSNDTNNDNGEAVDIIDGDATTPTKSDNDTFDVAGSLIFSLNITDQNQIDWVNNPDNSTEVAALFNFNSTNNTPEAKSFAELMVKTLAENPDMTIEDVDFEDRIINLLPEKAKCVFNKLKELNLFKTTIKKFENNKNYNLILEEGMNCNNSVADACTDASDLANGNITITFQSLGSSNLSLAASILHEGIHAEIYKYVDEHKKGIDPNDRPNVLYYYNLFKAKNALDQGTTFAQHEHMQDNYVVPLAEALRKLDGNRYPLEEYIGFGWDGLKVYKYDKYIDANGNIQTISSTDRTKLIDKANLIAASSNFAANCK